ncbi:hypothetical protein B6A42_06735 [Vibrio coralliilyticus]|nr:hypothetical protein B6A42_06735 [Vibrio coralliilyticus]
MAPFHFSQQQHQFIKLMEFKSQFIDESNANLYISFATVCSVLTYKPCCVVWLISGSPPCLVLGE